MSRAARFHVCLSDRPGAGRMIAGAASAEAAAALFLEHWSGDEGAEEVRLVVTEVSNGASLCLTVDLCSDGKSR